MVAALVRTPCSRRAGLNPGFPLTRSAPLSGVVYGRRQDEPSAGEPGLGPIAAQARRRASTRFRVSRIGYDLVSMVPRPASKDLALARLGDREALDRVLARNHERFLRLADHCLGDHLRALVRPSDLLQSAYLDVVKTVARFDGESEETFVTWVARILENTVRDKRRYFDAAKRTRLADSPKPEPLSAIADPSQPTPSRQITAREDLDVVEKAAANLPEDYRQILDLCVRGAMTHEEAAARMGRSPTATRILLSRARAALVTEVSRRRREFETPPSTVLPPGGLKPPGLDP